jgi:TolB protein
MTTQPRSDRHLPEILDGLYLGSTPAYRDDVLATATRSRQRPAWTFPGRWFPMVDIARQPAVVRRVPWRPIAVAVLILLMISAALAAYVGSRSHVPPPFGPAKNGLIAYSAADAVYTADPATGATKQIAAFGANVLVGDPWFSPDGTKILLTNRMQSPDNGLNLLWMMNADGSGLKQLTPEPLQDMQWNEFTPDGRSVLLVSTVAGTPSISIMNLDGSGLHTLDLGVPVGTLAFQPPDGRQILFNGGGTIHSGELYLVNTDGTNLRKLVSLPNQLYSDPVWSPDGSQIAYADDGTVHIMAADGSDDHVLYTGTGWHGWPKWSPDGTRLVVQGDDGTKPVVLVVRVDGTGQPVAIQTQLGPDGASYEWSPDSSVIFARPNQAPQDLQQQLWDPVTGAVKVAPWPARNYPTWQRLAP